MLEDHAADFIENSSPAHGVYGEHGAESTHKIFRLLQQTYCSMQPATIRLQSILKKNIIDQYIQIDAKSRNSTALRCRSFSETNVEKSISAAMIRIFITFGNQIFLQLIVVDCRFQKYDQSFKKYTFVNNLFNGESRFHQIATIFQCFLLFLNKAEFRKVQWVNKK